MCHGFSSLQAFAHAVLFELNAFSSVITIEFLVSFFVRINGSFLSSSWTLSECNGPIAILLELPVHDLYHDCYYAVWFIIYHINQAELPEDRILRPYSFLKLQNVGHCILNESNMGYVNDTPKLHKILRSLSVKNKCISVINYYLFTWFKIVKLMNMYELLKLAPLFLYFACFLT